MNNNEYKHIDKVVLGNVWRDDEGMLRDVICMIYKCTKQTYNLIISDLKPIIIYKKHSKFSHSRDMI